VRAGNLDQAMPITVVLLGGSRRTKPVGAPTPRKRIPPLGHGVQGSVQFRQSVRPSAWERLGDRHANAW